MAHSDRQTEITYRAARIAWSRAAETMRAAAIVAAALLVTLIILT